MRVRELSRSARRRALWASGASTFITLLPLLRLEREMMRSGGPGIIPFELAGTPERSREIAQSWGESGRAAARRSLILDYPYLVSYASLQAILCNIAGESMHKRGRETLAAAAPALAWGQFAAGGFDAIENAALLGTLARESPRLPALARACALAKFALLGAGWTYCLIALKGRARAQSARGV